MERLIIAKEITEVVTEMGIQIKNECFIDMVNDIELHKAATGNDYTMKQLVEDYIDEAEFDGKDIMVKKVEDGEQILIDKKINDHMTVQLIVDRKTNHYFVSEIFDGQEISGSQYLPTYVQAKNHFDKTVALNTKG